MRWILILMLSLVIMPAFANRHESFCWATPWVDDTSFNKCYNKLLTNPFSAIILPFETIAPGFGSLFIWGPLVFGLWYKTQSPAIAAIFGIVLVSVLQEPLYAKAVGIALVLVAVAAGIMFIQIFQRIKQTV